MTQWAWRAIDETMAAAELPAFIRILNLRMRKLADALSALLGSSSAVNTFPNGAATPSVGGARTWIVQNTVPTNITGFVDGEPGQMLLLWSTTANTTLVHSATLRLKGAVNVTMTALETRAFATVDGPTWREV